MTDLFRATPFAAPMAAVPLTCLDIGARGGIEPDLLPIAFAVDAVGFEPEPEAFARLRGAPPGPWRSLRQVPAAIAGTAGRRTLHITRDPQSTSLLPPVASTAARFAHTAWSEVVRTQEIETETLDGAVARHGIGAPDYLKLDIEGLEHEVLAAAPGALAAALAVKTEVSFLPLREGQPPACEIDRLLTGAGFALVALLRPALWRLRDGLLHPQMTPGAIPYSRGQLAHGDYLFFRAPETLGAAPERAMKAAWIALSYGYFDLAAEYLARPGAADALRDRFGIEPGPALAAAARRYGRKAWLAAFWQQVRGLSPFVRYARHVLRGG